jgi:methyl acetate hydrolase
MKRFRPVLPMLLVTLVIPAAPAQTKSPGLTETGTAAIDAVLQRAVKDGVVPGVVAMVATKDRILYEGAFGMMDVAKQKPMTKDAIFRLASMTKPVTSASVMMLVEDGKLRLDDPVSKYLSSFKGREMIDAFNSADATYTTKPAKEVLIRHLLACMKLYQDFEGTVGRNLR